MCIKQPLNSGNFCTTYCLSVPKVSAIERVHCITSSQSVRYREGPLYNTSSQSVRYREGQLYNMYLVHTHAIMDRSPSD